MTCCIVLIMIGNSKIARSALILIAAMTAGVLLALSWPRLRASLRFLPVDTAISNYLENREIETEQLDALIQRASESIAIQDHYRYWDSLSELQILRSQNMRLSFWLRRQALEDAILAAQEALKRAPTKPRTWLRIARAREFLAHPSEEVISSLKMSILTGRVEPTLMLPRLELGLRYLHSMDDSTLHLIHDQVLVTWKIQQRTMLERIQSGFLSLDMLGQVLTENDEAIVADIEAHLE